MSRKSTAPAPPPKRRHTTLKRIVYIVILVIALSIILQVLGLGVVNQRENDTLIEQPHAE